MAERVGAAAGRRERWPPFVACGTLAVAIAEARSPTWAQVSQVIALSSAVGTANARPFGVARTRCRNMSGIDR